mmetsp:Transcript_5640/g.4851  ORF Transcript_5640/g.4851 Transcript_5640/m.4851 type:complete len:142 (+) Transcript_5640:404-829(+)
MNSLINSYFKTENISEIEGELAGDMGIAQYLPLIRIENQREKSEIAGDVKSILCGLERPESADGSGDYTSLEIIKILLGIISGSISGTFYKNHALWGKYKEHDYRDVMDNVRETYIKLQVERTQRKIIESAYHKAKRPNLN